VIPLSKRFALGGGFAVRGEDSRSGDFFSYVRLEDRIAKDHPLRAIRELVDAALGDLSRAFSRLYSREGRPSIPPERLLRALLLQAFYTVRSERQLMEQLNYNLLFRWFVGLGIDDPVWDPTVFSKNRDRLLKGDIARKFMITVLNLPQVRIRLSSEHFSVDGTLIEAWASMKSFVPRTTNRHAAVKRPIAAATLTGISAVRNVRMTRTSRRRTRTPVCSAKVGARKLSCATWGTS
jgi:transposase